VTAREHQPQEVVTDHRVDRLGDIAVDQRQSGSLLRVTHRVATDSVDRAATRDDGEPGSRLGRDAVAGPGRQGPHDCILEGVLGQVDVAGDADQRREDTWILLADHVFSRVLRRCRSRHRFT